MKLVLAATIAFFLFLGSISYLNKKYKLPVSLPEENLSLSRDLAEKLKGSAIPDYVLKHAPLVFLEKQETFFPSDLASHVKNVVAACNFTPIEDSPNPLTLNNLDLMNSIRGEDVWLTSSVPLVTMPAWLRGKIPDDLALQTANARSSVIIVSDRGGPGVVDAFYFYFYSFNQGPAAKGHTVGNHMGDWEHNMIRFHQGFPQWIWYSQHESGAAYTFGAVDKIGERPVVWSARGSHANYATKGVHDYHDRNAETPKGYVFDYTSPGKLWDPTLSAYYYNYDVDTEEFEGVGEGVGTPEKYLYFKGHWGDEQLGLEMVGQEEFEGFWKWAGGPKGPMDKHLDRGEVCLPAEGVECVLEVHL